MTDVGLATEGRVQSEEGCHGDAVHGRLPLIGFSGSEGEKGNGACAVGQREDELAPHHQTCPDLVLQVEIREEAEVGCSELVPHAGRTQALEELVRVKV